MRGQGTEFTEELMPEASHLHYQLAFLTPGIKPRSASLRKQIRQMPNLRYTPRGRPHILQRFSRLVLNLGSRIALAILDLLATGLVYSLETR